jgi:hypothetical protein
MTFCINGNREALPPGYLSGLKYFKHSPLLKNLTYFSIFLKEFDSVGTGNIELRITQIIR